MELAPTAYVILGMLRLGRQTGYDIKQLVDRSTRFFWAASYGQIYPELKRLEDAGLIRGSADPQSGRRRRAYELTGEGSRVLDEWLRADDLATLEMRDEGLLKLFFAGGLPREDAAALARAAGARHAVIVATLEQVQAAGPDPDSMPAEVLRFGLDFHRWCVQRFAQMERDLRRK
jgi:DNA-binding PadR family transcriptional regulator